jgi:hypothetical protein
MLGESDGLHHSESIAFLAGHHSSALFCQCFLYNDVENTLLDLVHNPLALIPPCVALPSFPGKPAKNDLPFSWIEILENIRQTEVASARENFSALGFGYPEYIATIPIKVGWKQEDSLAGGAKRVNRL